LGRRMSKEYSKKILEATRRFHGTQYQPVLELASTAYIKHELSTIDGILSALPTDYQLLESLIEKIKGKPAYSTLRKWLLKEEVVREDVEIALSSLYTRILIESKDNPEFRLLKKDILRKITELS
jgi:hypothetical protein